MKTTVAALFLLFAAFAAFAQTPIDESTILVPINPGVVAGANGARWTTTLWAYNPLSQPVGLNCTDVSTCLLIPQSASASIPAPPGATHQGFFVHAVALFSGVGLQPVTRTPSLDLRTVDSVTAPQSAGTQIPLVHIDEFSSLMVFPHLPVNDHSRLKLRLYGTADADGYFVAWGLEQHANDPSGTLFTGVPYANQRFSLTGAVDGLIPSYAEVDLPANVDVSALRVYVQLLTPGTTTMWGFVTITDNQSQEITIATPTAPPAAY